MGANIYNYSLTFNNAISKNYTEEKKFENPNTRTNT